MYMYIVKFSYCRLHTYTVASLLSFIDFLFCLSIHVGVCCRVVLYVATATLKTEQYSKTVSLELT